MKYVRNSRHQQEEDSKPKRGRKKEIVLSSSQKAKVIRQIQSDIDWVEELSETEQFSREWIEKVLLELLLQCMGKKEILTTNMFGQQICARIFKERGAMQAVTVLAKMNGHLFDVVKGSVTKTIEGNVEHKHTVELIPDANKTAQVLDILKSCGAFPSRVKQLDNSEVLEIHPA